MLEKNRLIHPERRKSRVRHEQYKQVDPNAEITTAFINQAVSHTEGRNGPPPEDGKNSYR